MPQKPTILVIDDEKNTREGLRDAFDDKYNVLLADSAEKGIATLKAHKVDIVLTDLRMPGTTEWRSQGRSSHGKAPR